MKLFRYFITLLLAGGAAAHGAKAKAVAESARELPVAYEVDVVVVGGSSAGVAAALEAAKNGAKVFLAAPRPYLGEDLCATYRLWLEPGERPQTELEKAMFLAAAPEAAIGAGLPLSYTTDRKSFTKHADTTPPSLLTNGKWTDASGQSVQYNGDVTVIADLGARQDVKVVHVMAFQRPNDFSVGKVEVAVSDDRQQWRTIGVITNELAEQGTYEDAALDLSLKAAAAGRYVRMAVTRTESSDRILLGEIVVEGAGSAAETAKKSDAIVVKPMQVKLALDQALIQAGIPFLYSCYVTDVLRDGSGKPAGIVMANRSGRQAVIAKVIVDASEQAAVARMAGAAFSPFAAGPHAFSRMVVGGPARTGDGIALRKREAPLEVVNHKGMRFPIHEYTLTIPMADGSYAAYAKAEQIARDWTWTREAVDEAETLVPADPQRIQGRKSEAAWNGADRIALDAFQPAEPDHLYVLGRNAAISGEAAAQLERPLHLMAVGRRIGEAAARHAVSRGSPAGVKLIAAAGPAITPEGDVKCTGPEHGPRFAKARTVPAGKGTVPLLGVYDVIVIGGGTGGGPAAIAAGRQGAKTLLVEYLTQLGGVGTVGEISTYYHGNRIGYTTEIDEGVANLQGPENKTGAGKWIPTMKAEWLRQEARKYGVDMWFASLGVGAYVQNGRVAGVEVATPQGRGVVMAKVVIDATGGADIAAAAGAKCVITTESEVATQGTGLPPRMLAGGYLNTDYTYVDETDVFDITRAYVTGREKYKSAYDLGQLIDTRERRRIVGDVELTPMDAMLDRTWPDTIEIAKSNFDSHGYTVHPIFTLRPPHKNDYYVRVPYRALIPEGLDGLLVIGLGVSSHRDTLPLIRMQPDIQNQGYAAGVAAAMLAKSGKPVREVDMKALQQHLIDRGCLPKSVLAEKDSFPLPREQVAAAVQQVADGLKGLEVVLTQPDVAKPLLREALKAATDPKVRLTYAHILAMLHDPAGADLLIKEIAAAPWDKGWRFVAMGQFGANMSPLDSLIIAAGRSGDKRAVGPIVEKVKQLDATSDFSHFRAVALALEALGDTSAAPALAELLRKPGVGGHHAPTMVAALGRNRSSGTDTTTRAQELAELGLARALYRCGDVEGLGEKTLREYAADLRGFYARHAQAVLAAAKN